MSMNHWTVESDHLAVDYADRVFAITEDADGNRNWQPLGILDEDLRWPARLGVEPNWFPTELNELMDRMSDAYEGTHYWTAQAVYLEGIGAR